MPVDSGQGEWLPGLTSAGVGGGGLLPAYVEGRPINSGPFERVPSVSLGDAIFIQNGVQQYIQPLGGTA
ncbi:hypothetical protein N7519_009203 [Penicillium mononematosum]|uniref:uncharacterized protein n=1 Tax=Penicillium mononematosum TaxID=268346 RepID=UPI0025483CF1|nr:uncharacterized protein N7519_009203 [Penicillium mononematosum]KAJ6178742.1 hypothetical protein N7519_009203 [Penicillium mononematosum]